MWDPIAVLRGRRYGTDVRHLEKGNGEVPADDIRAPAFDDNGNLPAGIRRLKLSEVETFFTWHPTRRRLFRGLARAAANLSAAGVKLLWIGGSFVTSKGEPEDVDGCWEYGPWVDDGKLDPVFLDLAAPRQAMREKYGVDFQIAGTWLMDVHRPVEAFLQRDRDGNRRGILLVELGEET